MWLLRILAGFVVVLGLVSPGGLTTAEAKRLDGPQLDRTVARSSKVVFKGRADPRAVVKIQVEKKRWKTLSRVRANKNGRYRAAVSYPTKVRSYRVKSKGRVSAVRTVTPKPEPEAVVPEPAPVVDPTPPVEREPGPVDECGERPQRADGSYYECTFHDEFDGTALDTSKWLVGETRYSGMTNSHGDCLVDNGETIGVSSGILRVTALRQLDEFVCKSPLGDFVTTSSAGTVSTRGRFNQAYGRFEFRAKMPAEPGVQGSHSALWLFPQDPSYGVWPHSGEIDVAEWFSARPENVYPSVHYYGDVPLERSGGDCAMPTSSSGFHLYALEWTTEVMRFYYDGRLCFSHVWNPEGLERPAPFDKPFNLIVTQVWGHAWNAPTEETADTSTLEVDWVRAWR